MHDPFTGKKTCIRGRALPSAAECAALQGDFRRRLEALARLSAAASRVGIATHPDDDLVLWAEDELSLLSSADDLWSELAKAVVAFRESTPIVSLHEFGFPAESEEPLSEGSPHLRYLGGGVEAWAFAAADESVYKFYLPREGGTIAGSFQFHPAGDPSIEAVANLGTYEGLFQRIALLHDIGGMPAEVVGISPEGVLILKQVQGARIETGNDVQAYFPPGLIAIPSRLMRAHRDHPRFVFALGTLWFIADLHEKNFVVDQAGQPRLVDAISALFPITDLPIEEVYLEWLERARLDPQAPLLKPVDDDQL
jgi:hypothetical protein